MEEQTDLETQDELETGISSFLEARGEGGNVKMFSESCKESSILEMHATLFACEYSVEEEVHVPQEIGKSRYLEMLITI